MKVYKRPDMVGDKNPAKRPEVRKKIGAKLQGVKHSKQHKINIGKAGKGKKVWNKGLTEETDERVRKYAKVHKLPEMREKARERMKKIRAKIIFPLKDTTIEVKIQNFLSKLHIEFFTHKYMSEITHSYQCDILIPVQNGITQKTIIECDGCYWHGCPICKNKIHKNIEEIRKLDKLRTKELIEKEFRVIRLWEHEIKKLDLNKLKQKIK